MTRPHLRRFISTMVLAAATASTGCSSGAADEAAQSAIAVDASATAALRAAGRNASIEVLPTRVAGQIMAPVGEVVALLLERSGMTHLSLGEAPFVPPADADLTATATALGAFVRGRTGESDFTLFTDFSGARETGFTAVTAIIVDRQGRLAWGERLGKGDRAFDRSGIREPMDGCKLVASELKPVLSLGDPNAGTTPTGPIAERMQRRAGVPDARELAAIEVRRTQFCARAKACTVLVVPVRVNGAFSASDATAMAGALLGRLVSRASATTEGPTPARPSTMNQQQVAWTLARDLSAWVKARSVDTDYVLMTDCLVGDEAVMGVQFALCDAQGEIVMVDQLNDHQSDFAKTAPRTAAECTALVADRLKMLCRD